MITSQVMSHFHNSSFSFMISSQLSLFHVLNFRSTIECKRVSLALVQFHSLFRSCHALLSATALHWSRCRLGVLRALGQCQCQLLNHVHDWANEGAWIFCISGDFNSGLSDGVLFEIIFRHHITSYQHHHCRRLAPNSFVALTVGTTAT